MHPRVAGLGKITLENVSLPLEWGHIRNCSGTIPLGGIFVLGDTRLDCRTLLHIITGQLPSSSGKVRIAS